jgi:hypothetical protein
MKFSLVLFYENTLVLLHAIQVEYCWGCRQMFLLHFADGQVVYFQELLKFWWVFLKSLEL